MLCVELAQRSTHYSESQSSDWHIHLIKRKIYQTDQPAVRALTTLPSILPAINEQDFAIFRITPIRRLAFRTVRGALR